MQYFQYYLEKGLRVELEIIVMVFLEMYQKILILHLKLYAFPFPLTKSLLSCLKYILRQKRLAKYISASLSKDNR